MESQQLKNIVEAALLASGGPLTVDQLCALFGERDAPERQEVRAVLTQLQDEYADRGIELKQVASGFRVQVRENMAQWLTKLWEERPPRYSRALMETLAIIAYRQPVTRGDVENIRGVSVTTNIIRTLLERNWIKVVGHRDVPGKPAMFGTTREFLDYFDLKKLDDLPPLAELAALEPTGVQLELEQASDAAGPTDAGDETDDAAGDSQDPAERTKEDDPDAMNANTDAVEHSEAEGNEEDYSDDNPEADLSAADDDSSAEQMAAEAALVDDEDTVADVAPGAVAPLVGLNSPDEDEPESATVTSLDAVRARG